MKTLKRLLLPLFLLLASPAFAATGARYDNIAQQNLGGYLRPISGAAVTVCTSAGTGTPCTPKASIFSDIGMGTPLSNPITADINGNFGFYVAPGVYVITITSPSSQALTFTVTLPLAIDTSGNVSTAGALTVGGLTLTNATGGGVQCLQVSNTGVTSGTGGGCASSATYPISSLLAATGANTIANGNNGLQRWNWALTSNNEAFRISETSAATGGTLGNQALFKVLGTAGSTAVPLEVRGAPTGSQTIPSLYIDPVWNTTGVVDGALLVNVNNIASGTGSLLIDLQVGSVSKFSVDKTGAATAAGVLTLSNLAGSGTQCVQVNNSGVTSGTGAICGGTPTLSSLLAATTTNTILNGNNGQQIWDWQLTSNNSALVLRDASGSSMGTLGNQYVLWVDVSAAGSTAIPLGLFNSLNGSQTLPTLHVTPTWNTTGVVDAGILENVTNTASGTGSLLMDLQVGGTSKFSVDKVGNVVQAGTVNATTLNSNTYPANMAFTSGGVGCATSTSVFTTSTALTVNVLPKGGGTGACPGNSSITDNGSAISSSEAATFGGLTLSNLASGGTQCLQINNAGVVSGTGLTCPSAPTPPFSSLTGATATNAISNGNQPQEWDWQITSSSLTGLTLGEHSGNPSTGGSANIFEIFTQPHSSATPFNISQASGPVGASAPSAMAVLGGIGGDPSPSTTGTGNTGAGIVLTAGTGSSGGSVSGNGGVGGEVLFQSGSGGTVNGASNNGGTGGVLLFEAGNGGVGGGSGTGGAGGNFRVVPGAGGTGGTPGAPGQVLLQFATVSGALTTPFLNITGTWNTTGVVDAAIFANITNTASGASSLLEDLQVGSSSVFSVDKTGIVTGQKHNSLTNCAGVGTAASPSVASCGSASAGHFSCATNATGATCQVNTTAVTANSEIFVFESDTAATGTALGVTCNTSTTVIPTSRILASSVAATSFTINLGTVTTNPACFSYLVVN